MSGIPHPRIVLAFALAVAVAGVIGESVEGSAWMHLLSVVCVVAGLVAVVIVVPGLAGEDHDESVTDPRTERPKEPVGPRPPGV